MNRVVLLVDDNESFRTSTAWLLGAMGHAVREFASGEALLEAVDALLAERCAACVLTDVRMPGLDGLQLHDALIAREGRERAQFLFDRLADHALGRGVQSARARVTPYCNSIPLSRQPHYPGDETLEAKLNAALRWTAMAMAATSPLRTSCTSKFLPLYSLMVRAMCSLKAL